MRGNCLARSWNHMQHDVLLSIFMTLNTVDILFSVSKVCSSWRTACRDPLLWKNLDLSKVDESIVNKPTDARTCLDEEASSRLTKLLKIALSLSRGNVESLIFNNYICLTDIHLLRTARGIQNLRRLVLPSSNHVSNKGVKKCIAIWRELESLSLSLVPNANVLFKAIGKNCKNFSELEIRCPFDVKMANAIIIHLPKLKTLSLRSTIVQRSAVLHILSKLTHLEVINTSHCIFFQSFGIGQPGISICSESVFRNEMEFSRQMELATGRLIQCEMCIRFVHVNPLAGWFEFQKAMWMRDLEKFINLDLFL